MSFKKFEKGDILLNTIKAKPRFEFKIFKGNIYLNDSANGYAVLNSLGEPLIFVPPSGVCEQYAYDFSCEENSQYLSTI